MDQSEIWKSPISISRGEDGGGGESGGGQYLDLKPLFTILDCLANNEGYVHFKIRRSFLPSSNGLI